MPFIRKIVIICAAAALSAGCASAPPPVDIDARTEELRRAEIDFARTMADRDPEAFADHLSPETVFQGASGVHRGAEAVVAAWSRFFEGPDAPFSWAPEQVAVLETGRLGFNSGPVYSPEGERIGTFNSVWRRDDEGRWRIVFDRGCPDCECP